MTTRALGSHPRHVQKVPVRGPTLLVGPVTLDGDDNGNVNDAVDADGTIRRHRGIVGESDLSLAHNWRNRVVKVTITLLDG